jgi:hypothetical protein
VRRESVMEEALVGFQGRGCAEVVPPDFSHPLLLEPLLFQWPSKSVTLLERDGSRRPRNPIRALLDYQVVGCAAGERDTTPQAGVLQRCCISESTDGRIPLHAAWKLAKGKYMHLKLQQCHIPVIPAHVSSRGD